MRTLIVLAATLVLAACAGHPRDGDVATAVHDARCDYGCAHYHWEEADQYGY